MFSLLRPAALLPIVRQSSLSSRIGSSAISANIQRTIYTMSSATRYISAPELAAIIKSDKVPKKDYFVVDVRDDDFEGGNIKGSHNSPSSEFLQKVDGLVKETKDIPLVIFHCALSQVRGPKAARIYAETRDLLEVEGKDHAHEVLILRGGFSDFQAKYKDDPDLVENWDKDVWGSEWSI